MARRDDLESRDAVSIFNLSFLDVFACALGALILILLMIFNQVSIAFDTETIKEEIEEIEGKKDQIVTDVRENSAAESDAREWDETKDLVKSNISKFEAELSKLQMAAATNPNVTTDTIIKAQQAVSQMQAQTAQRRDSVNNIWFGSGAMSQKVRFVEVDSGQLVDHGDGKKTIIKLNQVGSFIERMQSVRSSEYPLFIIHPNGLEVWSSLEGKVESAGIAYGFEPFTKVWAPILESGQK